MAVFNNVERVPHPFYPIEAEVVGYLANSYSVSLLLTLFMGGCAAILGATWGLTSYFLPKLGRTEKSTVLWFILCGIIHSFFEGYFAVNHLHMGSAQDLFGQLWKEYALSDSRYLTSDPFVLCMESITAFLWGPLSFYTAYLVIVNHPLRFPLQAVVSLGQIYGDILYYATCMFNQYHFKITYCRPEAYYFWFYFFFMNFIWIVIPGALLAQSIWATSQAFATLQKMSTRLQSNGSARGPSANGHLKHT